MIKGVLFFLFMGFVIHCMIEHEGVPNEYVTEKLNTKLIEGLKGLEHSWNDYTFTDNMNSAFTHGAIAVIYSASRFVYIPSLILEKATASVMAEIKTYF